MKERINVQKFRMTSINTNLKRRDSYNNYLEETKV